MSRLVGAQITVVLVVLAMLLALPGCDSGLVGAGGGGGNNGGGGGGGATVPMGNMRMYNGNDTWNYRLTGNLVQTVGGTVGITPATAVLRYASTDSVVGGQTVRELRLEVPVAYPGHNEVYVYVLALLQAADGRLTLHGIQPAEGTPMGVLANPIVAPAPANMGTITNWSDQSQVDGYGDFSIQTTRTGTEVITAGGHSFETYRVEGSKSFGGFPSQFTLWINRHLGSFVRMTTSYVDMGGTLNLTYDLQSTSFNL